MALPLPARVTLGTGMVGLLLVVLNQLSAPLPEPSLVRASVLAAWAYLRADPVRWQPYWRWVVLAEWLGRTA